ncbi:unnamed protein product [Pelagomonas calceolata]|uniref:Uncharacterized protein n=1 Tax=Pelagomonas calceolata TaxID=35677 RepID=A0A8J2X057_9STRA|nr:unnamed protein product [Pelagomonas calceolata]
MHRVSFEIANNNSHTSIRQTVTDLTFAYIVAVLGYVFAFWVYAAPRGPGTVSL